MIEATHIHYFFWLVDAPNMNTLDWEDVLVAEVEKHFFDKYVTAWNPRNDQLSTFGSHHSTTNDPCSLASKYSVDYEELVNFFQRHTRCSESTCLRKKGTPVQGHYGFPYDLQVTS